MEDEIKISKKEYKKFKNGKSIEIAKISTINDEPWIITLTPSEKELKTMFSIINEKNTESKKAGLSINVTGSTFYKDLFEKLDEKIKSSIVKTFDKSLDYYSSGYLSKCSWKKPKKSDKPRFNDYVSQFDIFYDKETGRIYESVKFCDMDGNDALIKYKKLKKEKNPDISLIKKYKKIYTDSIDKHMDISIKDLNNIIPPNSVISQISFSIPEVKFIDNMKCYNVTFKLINLQYRPSKFKKGYAYDEDISDSDEDEKNEIKNQSKSTDKQEFMGKNKKEETIKELIEKPKPKRKINMKHSKKNDSDSGDE